MHPEIQELFREVEGLTQAGQLDEAEQALSEILELARVQNDPVAEAIALGDLAAVQAALGDSAAAQANWQAAAAVFGTITGSEWECVRSVLWPYARYARDHDAADQADAAYAQAAVLLGRLAPGSESFTLHLADLLFDWSEALAEEGDDEQAEVRCAQAVEALVALPDRSPRAEVRLAEALERHAEALTQLGNLDTATQTLRRARQVSEQSGYTEGVVTSLVRLAQALWSGGEIAESRRMARDAASQAEDAAEASPAVRGEAFENQARFLLAEGKEEEADTYFQLAEILYRRQAEESDPDHWIVPLQMVVAQRATLLVQRNDLRAAAGVVQELVDFWRPYLDAEPDRRLTTFLMPAQRLVQLYQSLGEAERAQSVLARVRELQAA